MMEYHRRFSKTTGAAHASIDYRQGNVNQAS